MPLPKPDADETEDAFTARCMSDGAMLDEFPGEKQRTAVCASLWEGRDEKSNALLQEKPARLVRKSFGFSLKALEGETEGVIEGYGSTFGNIDRYDDIIEAGAFKKSIRAWKNKGLMPTMLFGHDTREPIGEWEEMKEDGRGLFLKGRLWLDSPTEAVRKAWNLARSNATKGLSIGFNILKQSFEDVKKRTVRKIQEVDLWETSVVTFPANELAGITSAKSLLLQEDGEPVDKKTAEAVLRDALGLSARQAKRFLAGGWSALVRDEREDADRLEKERAALESLLEKFS